MALSTTDSDDYLTCGRCLAEFQLQNITKFIEHKKRDCAMPNEEENKPGFRCSSCPQGFMTAVGLLRHVQFTHNLQVFLENGPYQSGIQQTSVSPQCTAEECTVCQSEAYQDIPPQPQQDWGENPLNLAKNYQPQIETGISASQSDAFSSQMIPTNIENNFDSIHGNNDLSNVGTSIRTEMPDNCLSSSESVGLSNVMPDSSENLRYSSSAPEVMSESGTKEAKETENDVMSTEFKKPQGDIMAAENEEDDQCCTSQKCGVTVIPGSHESLQKCCYAVAPKKRKRHMETKHMPSYWSSRLGRRRSYTSLDARNAGNRPINKSSGTIYIDLEPETGKVTTSHSKDRFSPKTTRTTNIGTSNNFDFQLSGFQRKSVIGSSSQQKSKSVILQPGAVFSIPISYTVPADPAEANIPSTTSQTIRQEAESTEKVEKVPEQSVMSQNIADTSLHVMTSDIGQTSAISGVSDPQRLAVSSEGRTYGIDVQSLIAMATSNMGISSSVDDAGQMSNHDADIAMSHDMKQGRKRRYPTSKPFKCDQCDHAFNQRIHLKKHMSKHTGIKPFKCQQCNYSTVERSHLKVHIRIHTGEKPFKCTYCEYATAQNSTLKIHLKRHHGKQGGSSCDFEECKTCGKMFSKEDLEVHKTDHENVNSRETDHSDSGMNMLRGPNSGVSETTQNGETHP